MKITISDSKGDSISITIGKNGTFQELNKPTGNGHEMHMDFSSGSDNREKESSELDKTTACFPGNVKNQELTSSLDCSEKSADSSNLQLLEDQVESCLNQIRIEPDIKVSISPEKNRVSNPKSLCRLCANPGSEMVYMFETSGRYKNIINKIEDCLPILVTKTDTLPKEACRSCLEQLELCYKFHKIVAEAEKHFLILGGRISYDSEKTTNYCQTISENSGTRSSSLGEENGVNLNRTSLPQAVLSTCYSGPNSPICAVDSEDESSLAERLADSQNNKFVNNERKRARPEDILDGEETEEKVNAGQSANCNIIMCQICGESFETVQGCYKHSTSHVTDNYYPCSLCDEIFTAEKDWSEHGTEHKEDSEADKEVKTYACSECGKKFVTQDRLQFHKRYHSPNANPCYCKLCNTITDSESALYQHHRTVHGQCKEFRCDLCGKQFRTQASVNAHQRKHRYIRSFECTICNKTFYSKDTLEMHKETHSSKKNFSCLYCGKSFAQKLPLKLHIQSHTENQSQSSDSNRKTASVAKSEKDNHRKSVPGNRPFKCLVCERTFDHSARLREHSSVHTGKRPYSCSLCDKSFKRANARKVHMIIHTGEKPHRCDMCGTHFRRAGDMRRHKKTQHGQNE